MTANRIQTTALLDSGATHNFISRALAKECGAVLVWATPMCVSLATKSHVVSSQVATLTLLVGGVAQCLECRVVPELAGSLVLGYAWLQAVNPAIDWQQRTVKFEHAGETVCVSAAAASYHGKRAACRLLTATQM